MSGIAHPINATHPQGPGLIDKLNGVWHEKALRVYLVIVIAHWAEHLLQAFQIWGLGMARPDAKGALGMVWPWLVTSEWLHYGYAIVMLIGLIILRPGFVGTARTWWTASLLIQFWHHIEHFAVLTQAVTHNNWFGKPVPTSFVQLVVPRVELHLFYNAVVFVPMVIAMYYHLRPPAGDPIASCACGLKAAKHRAASA
jgi:hypothetical protein